MQLLRAINVLTLASLLILTGCLENLTGGMAEDNTEGGDILWAFGGEDASGEVSDANDDRLILVTMSRGADLNWASVSVNISINNTPPITCANNYETSEDYSCHLVSYGTNDQLWSVGEHVTIVESGEDLCTSACGIEVTIIDTREGRTLDEAKAVAG